MKESRTLKTTFVFFQGIGEFFSGFKLSIYVCCKEKYQIVYVSFIVVISSHCENITDDNITLSRKHIACFQRLHKVSVSFFSINSNSLNEKMLNVFFGFKRKGDGFSFDA